MPFGTADLHAKHTLKVELEGAGILEAVGSANPCSEERYDTPESETFDGCCMAVIRAGDAAGEIHLTVTADGIVSSYPRKEKQSVPDGERPVSLCDIWIFQGAFAGHTLFLF